jgi:hypothetical protein
MNHLQKGNAALWLVMLTALFASARPAQADASPEPADFGFLSWDAAPPYFQGHAEQTSQPRVLWIETGRYSLAVDTRRLELPHAGNLKQSRETVLTSDRKKARALPAGLFDLRVIANGEVFSCEGVRESKNTWAYPVRFVETGRWLQHVDLDGLILRSREGREMEADAHLEISAWPDRATFLAEVKPRVSVTNLTVLLAAEARGLRSESVTTTSNSAVVMLLATKAIADSGPPPEVKAMAPDQSAPVVLFREDLCAWEVKIEGAAWSNPSGTYYPANHLDRLDRWPVTLRNDCEHEREMRLIFTRTTFTPITGLTPMWLDADGFPTGLAVQLSKNWHSQPARGHLRHEGPWLRASTVVRVPPRSVRRLDFALCYARYGGVFAASHAQLSLIGWGHNTFWDQAALGSFGESICFEPGRVQRRCFITDVRPFLVTHPPKTKRWEWTANVGGGDFLVYFDGHTNYVPFARTRTDYRVPGPCLTRTTYSETSADGAIAACMTVSLAGAADHVRVFMHLRYDVRRDARFSRLAFLQLGSDFYNGSWPGKLAVGNASGLIEEWSPGEGSWAYDRRNIPLAGVHPWISAHEERFDGAKGEGGGTRGLIVRSWHARLGGVKTAPRLATYLTEDGPRHFRTALELATPPALTALKAGDFVEADLEWCVFPRCAEDYYGPDESFRNFLREGADTWKPVHHEATGNAVVVDLTRGTLESTWPLRLRVGVRQRAAFTLARGLGHVPVTFTGLHQPRGFVLNRNGAPMAASERGDFWQAEFDEATDRWSLTCLLQADQIDGAFNFGPVAASVQSERPQSP